jgi:hypothetical protein
MSLEKLAGSLGDTVERKTFLRRAGIAALGAFGFAGLRPGSAAAYATHGCNLCNPPGACGPRLDCVWCWPACYQGHWWQCCEGRQAGGNCNSGACPSYCSYYTGPGSAC